MNSPARRMSIANTMGMVEILPAVYRGQAEVGPRQRLGPITTTMSTITVAICQLGFTSDKPVGLKKTTRFKPWAPAM